LFVTPIATTAPAVFLCPFQLANDITDPATIVLRFKYNRQTVDSGFGWIDLNREVPGFFVESSRHGVHSAEEIVPRPAQRTQTDSSADSKSAPLAVPRCRSEAATPRSATPPITIAISTHWMRSSPGHN